jgi:hypothetical protein
LGDALGFDPAGLFDGAFRLAVSFAFDIILTLSHFMPSRHYLPFNTISEPKCFGSTPLSYHLLGESPSNRKHIAFGLCR